MPCRSAALAVVALLAIPAGAVAGSGGSLAGTLTIDWQSAGAPPGVDWSGHAVVAIDGGEAARLAAIATLSAAPSHKRQPNPFFNQGGHIAAFSGALQSTEDCAGTPETRTQTVTGVADERLPLTVDPSELDLLRGRGAVDVNLALDNLGDPLPLAGRYFLPAPGSVHTHETDSGCADTSAPPSATDSDRPAFDGARDAAIPFAFASWLNTWKAPLRLANGQWSARGTAHFADDYSGVPAAITVAYDVRLASGLRAAAATCALPTARTLSRARSARAALAILRRAGFPRARLAVARRNRYVPRGRYAVDSAYAASPYVTCLTARPPVRRSLG